MVNEEIACIRMLFGGVTFSSSASFPPSNPADQQDETSESKKAAQQLKRVQRNIPRPGGKDAMGSTAPADTP
jgi:hypothetical protein